MATAKEYEERIRALNWEGLHRLWRQIRNRSTTEDGWEPGKALEYLFIRGFELEGCSVHYPYEVRRGSELIEQIDGVVYTENASCLVECKDQQRPINIDPIAKLRSLLQRRPEGTLGLFVGPSGFTEPAVTLTSYLVPPTILLWWQIDISTSLERRSLTEVLDAKYRYCLENAVYDYSPFEDGKRISSW